MLPKPELYDLSMDPDESYDVANEHPDVVKRMVAEMETAIETFPPDIRKAWSEIKARKAAPVDAGNVPRPA